MIVLIVNSIEYVIVIMLLFYLFALYIVRRKVKTSVPFIATIAVTVVYTLTLILLNKGNVNPLISGVSSHVVYLIKSYLELFIYSGIVFFTSSEENNLGTNLIKTFNFILLTFFVLDSINLLASILGSLITKTDYSFLLGIFTVKFHIISLLIIGAFLIFLFTRKSIKANLNKKNFLVLIIVAVCFAIAPMALIQPYTNAIAFVVTLCIYTVYVVILNPGKYFNYDYNVFNREALQNLCTKETVLKEDVTYICIKVKKVRFLNEYIRENSINLLLLDLLDLEKNYYGYKNVYYLENETYLIRIKNFSVGDFFVHQNITYKNLLNEAFSLSVYPSFIKNTFKKRSVVSFKEIKEFVTVSSLAFDKFNQFELVDYNTDIIVNYKREQDIVSAIRKAIYNRSFKVYYQPIYDVLSNKSLGAEALVRLFDDKLGFISPEEFIPIAERYGIVEDIDLIVMDKVTDFLVANSKNFKIEYIDVNLSHQEISNVIYINEILELIEKKKVPFTKLHLEITETTNYGDEKIITENMYRLRKLGFLFSLDDYGSRYASIDYLTKYKFDIIKIDKSILWGIDKNKEMIILLQNIVKLAASINKKIVMEGVESAIQVELLKDLGVNFMQGYYFSRPISSKDYLEFLLKEDTQNE